ncbi:auxin-responsive protein SAUR32-like [Miscanthus floridulus]|uniref:auxin-responsive protein SAUR32-like n=1 Tax=Miscanthus floridulus TaxID=154761 RepID=UPI003457AD10
MIWKRKTSGRGGSCSGRDEMRERLIPAAAGGGCAAGCVAVLVGGGEEPERVVVDVRALARPCVRALLEAAQREFGFDQKGVLRIPCAADEFRRAVAAGGHRCRR